MAASRLATPDGCLTKVENEFTAEAELAWGRASPKQRESSVPFTYSGCGGSWTDDAVVFAPDGSRDHQRARAVVRPDRRDPGAHLLRRPAGRPAAVPVGHPGRPGSPRSSPWRRRSAVCSRPGASRSPTTRRGALLDVFRRLVVPWAAGLIVLGAAFVVLLVLVRDNLLYPERLLDHRVELAAIGVVLAIRLFSDAMLSSLHPFYRERLSDSFLVRRTVPRRAAAATRHRPHVSANGAESGPELCVAAP